ncbi:MAG TPA: hypothetical protein VFS17_03685 [Methylophilaceae bacterium]|nr:hypothetical protein [Methylophilaceae bacterium]
MATMDSMAARLLGLAALLASPGAWACFDCRKLVEARVYGPDFASNLLALLMPLAVLGVLGVLVYFHETILDRLKNARQLDQ